MGFFFIINIKNFIFKKNTFVADKLIDFKCLQYFPSESKAASVTSGQFPMFNEVK